MRRCSGEPRSLSEGLGSRFRRHCRLYLQGPRVCKENFTSPARTSGSDCEILACTSLEILGSIAFSVRCWLSVLAARV